MNRRDLVQKVLIGSTALIIMPSALTSCKKDPGPDPNPNPDPKPDPGTKIIIDLTLAGNAELNTAGGSKIVQSIIVVNLGADNFIALDSICTHQGCTVGYSQGVGHFVCPCHGSEYSTTGSVLVGPAPSALKSYSIVKAGDILTITV